MKTRDELFAEMKADYCDLTGFSMDDGADLAVRLWAFAAQLENLYRYAHWCVEQAFPQTAVGENLDRHGTLRALTRKGSSCAEGVLRFSVPAALGTDTPIAEGTVCTTLGLQRFVTTASAVIQAGATYVDVPAKAESPGTGGNTAAGTVTVLTLPPTGVTEVTNPAAFTGGAAAETDALFRERILETYRQLPNGANAAWYWTRAMDHTGVAAAVVQPRVNGVGTVGVIIASEEGAPSQELLDEVEEDLQSAREIGVELTVSGPTLRTVNITAALTPAEGWTFERASDAVEEAIRGLFGGRNLGLDLNRARIIAAAVFTGAVENIVLSAPAADLTAQPTELLQLGTLTLTEDS